MKVTKSSDATRGDPSRAGRLNLCVALAILFLLSLDSAWALDPRHLLSQYGHTAWRIQDGYFGSAVTSIAQTADGYLWIGTVNGLFRFDGVRFVPWSRLGGQQLPGDLITSLSAARDGSLWIGTISGLSHWLNSKLININAPPLPVQSMAEDENGVIWFIHPYLPSMPTPHEQLCRVIGMDTQCYGTADGIPDMRYWRLATDTGGNVWMAGSSAVVRWSPASHTSTVYTTKALQSGAYEGQPGVIGLAANSDGSILGGMTFRGPDGGFSNWTVESGNHFDCLGWMAPR